MARHLVSTVAFFAIFVLLMPYTVRGGLDLRLCSSVSLVLGAENLWYVIREYVK